MLDRILVRDGAFYKKLCGIAIPIALQQLITVGVNILVKGVSNADLSIPDVGVNTDARKKKTLASTFL